MQTRTDELVKEVFTLTKTKLSPDDPLLTLILLQEKGLQRAFELQNASRADQDKVFLKQLDERLIKINAMYAELTQYRERVVAELMAKNQQVAVQIEGRVTEKGRSFIKGLRYNLPANKPIAAAVLSDTEDMPTALYLANDEDERLTEQLDELIAGSHLANWR